MPFKLNRVLVWSDFTHWRFKKGRFCHLLLFSLRLDESGLSLARCGRAMRSWVSHQIAQVALVEEHLGLLLGDHP